MPIINRVAEFHEEAVGWRHELHRHPEILFDVHRTAAFVAARLGEFGVDEIVTGLGRTGVVGVIRGNRGPGGTIGLRSDMDALPIEEATGAAYASTIPGAMHACGHDGHAAMLLAAARHLAETRNFAGTAVVIFQPAEEGGGGGREMVEDGLMERFGIDQVYGMHNLPGLDVGRFAIRNGPIMASTDEFNLTIRGRGGHAARPQETVDTVMIGAQLVGAMQTIVSRTVDPLDSLVVSVTKFHAGDAHNVIPETARLGGTVRTLKAETRDLAERRIREIAAGVAAAHGAIIDVEYNRNYPVTRNHAAETGFAAEVAAEVVGADRVSTEAAPMMAGEDFAYMLEARPGAFIFIGNGPSAGLHNPHYDFNDAALPVGASYWVRLVERALAPG
ncbi:M20 aminoacylase family protein [Prosthecomicrobium pneumaticum]|uniref:Hippurate hydrolase n=1 Tax=Prosthecomicrobium pneumaticum TaxID=81895 RepID=A0A7W9FK98_9HYPH|nr:M20 aminoacylase family protein [Prosthecomicrobium pneumaticum]MBB5752426.1 hippurate hydrolase [Prosthecomicrobium pneumaticum]